MSVPALIPRPPRRKTRHDDIAEAVSEALLSYRDALDAPTPLRELTVSVKMREDGGGVRAVLVSLQGEIKFEVRGS